MSTPSDLYRLSYSTTGSRRSTSITVNLYVDEAPDLAKFIEEIAERAGVEFKCEKIPE